MIFTTSLEIIFLNYCTKKICAYPGLVGNKEVNRDGRGGSSSTWTLKCKIKKWIDVVSSWTLKCENGDSFNPTHKSLCAFFAF